MKNKELLVFIFLEVSPAALRTNLETHDIHLQTDFLTDKGESLPSELRCLIHLSVNSRKLNIRLSANSFIGSKTTRVPESIPKSQRICSNLSGFYLLSGPGIPMLLLTSARDERDIGSVPESGRSPGIGNANSL